MLVGRLLERDSFNALALKKILQRLVKVFFPQHLLDLSLNDATHRGESNFHIHCVFY